MRRAIDIALESEQEGNLPIGCVVVLDGEIVGQGHSAVVEPEYTPGRHAEIVALDDVDDRLWPRAGEMTCYTTLEPCVMCAGTLLLHGVGRVVFGAYDTLGGAGCILDHLPPYYDEGGVYDWEGPLMPEVCDSLYERADEAFEDLPVGKGQWEANDESRRDVADRCRDRLQQWRQSDSPQLGIGEARQAIENLAATLEGAELVEVIPYASTLFERSGYLKDLRALRDYARRAGAADPIDDVKEAVCRELPDVWIKTLIDRGEIDEAVDVWFQHEDHHRARLCADELIEACDASRTQVVISCRLSVVSYLIGRRSRRHYRRACDVLRRLKDELQRGGEADYWQFVIDDLQQQYDQLPALLDELERAGFIDA